MSLLTALFGSHTFAIDFSDRSLRLLALGGRTLNKLVLSSSRIEVPEGLIVHAEIKDQEAVSELIRTLVHDAGPKKISSKKVIAGVPEAQVYSVHITAPKELVGEELDIFVLDQATNFLPFTLETIAWDYEILTTSESEHNILFAAIKKEIVQGYADTLMLAGLDLMALEPEAVSLVRALVTKKMVADEKAVAIVDIGACGTKIVFADALGQQLVVSKPIGGKMITEELAQKHKLTGNKAESLKIKEGMKADVKYVAKKVFEPIVTEFITAKEFYETKTKRKVTNILLSGGVSQMKGLAAYFQEKWGAPVTVPDGPFAIGQEAPASTAILAGLALRDKNPKIGLSFVIPD